MECLLDYSYDEIKQKLNDIGITGFRVSQVFDSLYRGKNFVESTNLGAELKQNLMNNFVSQPLSIIDKKISQDGTVKFLFKLQDNNIIEGVLMNYKYGYTLCVSSQVGCGMKCAFCASGINGLIRNLSAGEILGQVILANRFLEGGLKDQRKITNVVLMGSGEPLTNYENVTKFLDLLGDERGLNISQRNISLSTCGIVPNIAKLADDGYKVTLTISLHAPNDEIRKKLMPIANKYTIKEVLTACKYYQQVASRRIVFEYTLVRGLNNSYENAKELAHITKGLSCHINVIPLNSVPEKNLEGVTRDDAKQFVGMLTKLGVSATLRRTLGEDIDGACGQLRRKYLQDNKIE